MDHGVRIYNPAPEIDVGGHPWLHSKYTASLGHMTPCLKERSRERMCKEYKAPTVLRDMGPAMPQIHESPNASDP